MRWTVVIGLVAIAFLYFLYTGIVAGVSSLTPATPAGGPAAAPPALPVTVGTPMWLRPSGELASDVSSTAKAPVAPLSMRTPTSPASINAPQQTLLVRRGPGGSLRRQITAGLSDLRSRLAACPDSGGHSDFSGEESTRANRPSVLVLELATRNGTVEVLDVPREKRRRASDAFMACARAALRGQVIPVEDAKAGTHLYMSFHLGAL